MVTNTTHVTNIFTAAIHFFFFFFQEDAIRLVLEEMNVLFEQNQQDV